MNRFSLCLALTLLSALGEVEAFVGYTGPIRTAPTWIRLADNHGIFEVGKKEVLPLAGSVDFKDKQIIGKRTMAAGPAYISYDNEIIINPDASEVGAFLLYAGTTTAQTVNHLYAFGRVEKDPLKYRTKKLWLDDSRIKPKTSVSDPVLVDLSAWADDPEKEGYIYYLANLPSTEVELRADGLLKVSRKRLDEGPLEVFATDGASFESKDVSSILLAYEKPTPDPIPGQTPSSPQTDLSKKTSKKTGKKETAKTRSELK